jgi:hypothetical protein
MQSVKAYKDGAKKEKTFYYSDHTIFNMDIQHVLLWIEQDAEYYKNPTKENLKKSMENCFKFYSSVFADDYNFYAKEVIPKFLKKGKVL